jgi:hypothetical protein
MNTRYNTRIFNSLYFNKKNMNSYTDIKNNIKKNHNYKNLTYNFVDAYIDAYASSIEFYSI